MKLSKFILLSLILTLTACGYHLRGSGGAGNLNIHSVYVELQNAVLIANELKQQFEVRDVTVKTDAQSVDRILRLSNEQYDRRVLSVDEGTGKVTEYELEYRIVLEILSQDGNTLAEPQDVSLIRDVTFDPDAALGKFDEETIVRNDMIRSAVDSILRRLQAVN